MKKLFLIIFTCWQCGAEDLHFAWEQPYINDTNIVVEIWHSLDLINWSIKEITPASQTNYFVAPNLDCEFFKIRNKNLTTGNVSIWSN